MISKKKTANNKKKEQNLKKKQLKSIEHNVHFLTRGMLITSS